MNDSTIGFIIIAIFLWIGGYFLIDKTINITDPTGYVCPEGRKVVWHNSYGYHCIVPAVKK